MVRKGVLGKKGQRKTVILLTAPAHPVPARNEWRRKKKDFNRTTGEPFFVRNG